MHMNFFRLNLEQGNAWMMIFAVSGSWCFDLKQQNSFTWAGKPLQNDGLPYA